MCANNNVHNDQKKIWRWNRVEMKQNGHKYSAAMDEYVDWKYIVEKVHSEKQQQWKQYRHKSYKRVRPTEQASER